MNLAKSAIDVGLFVDGDGDAVLNHWSHTIGVPFDEMLPTGGGVRQHRHALGNSVIKINHSRDALDPTPSAGYRELLIANAKVASETDVTDPEGNIVKLVPPGDVTQLRLRVATPNVIELLQFYCEVLQLKLASKSVAETSARCQKRSFGNIRVQRTSRHLTFTPSNAQEASRHVCRCYCVFAICLLKLPSATALLLAIYYCCAMPCHATLYCVA